MVVGPFVVVCAEAAGAAWCQQAARGPEARQVADGRSSALSRKAYPKEGLPPGRSGTGV
ncbi:hypothetical protein [Streptomyces sp. NPDC046976]|uniref:hypothetical protein n=1 Tax=Streptomyces sp. NPDC046976 TaxID=3155258 RepID=UPI0033F80A8B